jgi:hypothetical protein
MNGLSKRVNYILECLSKEWKDDCNNKKEETTTSEGDKGP